MEIWRFYRARGDAAENRIKELKEDFGAGGFCLQSFDGTEASFRLVCFLFNLVALFKRDVTRDESPKLDTLRTRLLVVGGILGSDAGKPVLRLGLRVRWREAFRTALSRVAQLVEPTVPQLAKLLQGLEDSPRPWQIRRPRPRRSPARIRLAGLAM